MDDSDGRLFRFSKPQWFNSANARTAGIYSSGALVRIYQFFLFSRTPLHITWQTPLSIPSSIARLHQAWKLTRLGKSQFSLGFFFLIDAAAFSHSRKNGSFVHVKFVDWIPGICSALGMLVINSIEKSRLSADSFSYSGNGVAWKARFVLFLGFALLAGGLAGSVVCLLYSALYILGSYYWPRGYQAVGS